MYNGPSYEGVFEVHVTVKTPTNPEQFRKDLPEGTKAILIQLNNGEYADQLMANSFIRGNVDQAYLHITNLSNVLQVKGYEVIRLKIEAFPTNIGVPVTDEEATSHPAENYFEFHAKLLLEKEPDDDLIQLIESHGARISRNLFKTQGKQHERFITLRQYMCGRETAEFCFNALLKRIMDAGHKVVHKIKEYTVYDTNIELDKGWISHPCAGCDQCIFMTLD